MIREAAITSLLGRVGFRQPIDSAYAILDADNIKTDSGKYFDDASGLVSVKNIVDTYEYDDPTTVQINTILDNMRSAAARSVLSTLFSDQSKNLESNTLFPYEEEFSETYDLTNDFYFIEIIPPSNKRVVFSLDNIYLSFNEAKTFNIYLYHSKSISPIQTKEVTTVENEATKVELNYNLDLTGTYRIGYKKADIGTAKPFKRDFQLSSVFPLSNYAKIYFRSADFLTNGRIDVDNENALEDGYGINIEYSTFTDFTQEIIKNKSRFDRAYQLQMAIDVADRIKTSTRSNITERLITQSYSALGTENDGRGYLSQFKDEINKIKGFFFPKEQIINSTLR